PHGGHGAGHQETLAPVAVHRTQLLQLLRALDALRHDLYPQVPAELDDGVGQQRDGVVPAQVGGEGRVDLDRVHAQLTQVRKGGITHAVVVDGQLHTEFTQFGQTGDRLLTLVQEDLLG